MQPRNLDYLSYQTQEEIERCQKCRESQDAEFDQFAKVWIVTMAFVLLFIVTAFNKDRLYYAWNRYKNRNNTKPQKSSKSSLKNKPGMIQQKQQALEKTELKTAKHWAEKKDDFVIDEDYLKELDELIASQEEWLYPTAQVTPEIADDGQDVDVSISENDSKEEINPIKIRRTATFGKRERPADALIQPVTANDKVLMWHANLPGYNLSKHSPTDPTRAVYPLGSGNRFVFINKYLKLFLESNHLEAYNRLLHLCDMGRDQLPNKSKGQSGFIFREEGNAGKAKSSDTSDQNRKEKNTNTNTTTTYVKVKDCVQNYRFFGASVATVNQKKVLFEVNGFRPRHKKQDRITYFPSEASTPKLK